MTHLNARGYVAVFEGSLIMAASKTTTPVTSLMCNSHQVFPLRADARETMVDASWQQAMTEMQNGHILEGEFHLKLNQDKTVGLISGIWDSMRVYGPKREMLSAGLLIDERRLFNAMREICARFHAGNQVAHRIFMAPDSADDADRSAHKDLSLSIAFLDDRVRIETADGRTIDIGNVTGDLVAQFSDERSGSPDFSTVTLPKDGARIRINGKDRTQRQEEGKRLSA